MLYLIEVNARHACDIESTQRKTTLDVHKSSVELITKHVSNRAKYTRNSTCLIIPSTIKNEYFILTQLIIHASIYMPRETKYTIPTCAE